MLLKNRGFTLIAVLTIALGIGANTAIFSVVNAVLLRPLPYKDPDRIFWLQNSNPQGNWPLSEPEFVEFRDHNRVLDAVAAIDLNWMNLTGRGEPLRALAMLTSP